MLENETADDDMDMMSGNSGNRNGAQKPMNSRCVERNECERLVPSSGCSIHNHQHQLRCNYINSHLPLDLPVCNCSTEHGKPRDTLINCCYCDECDGGDGDGCYCQQCCSIGTELTGSVFDSDEIGANEQNIRDGDYCLRTNRLSDNCYSGTLQRFAIYENLCQRCGYGVGCGCAPFNEALFNESYEDENENDNIYENVCDTCAYIYSGDRCALCKQRESIEKKSPTAGKQLTKFAELLSNLRQRLRDKTQKSSPRTVKPRPQIVHNIGDVFKTNQTFSLSEIVRLREQKHTLSIEKSVYGKLRNSDEYLSRRFSDRFRTIKASASDSNFLTNSQLKYTPFIDATTNVTDHPIYENLPIQAESVPFSPYECRGNIPPALPPPRVYDIHIHSLRNWMTSLRGQTYDYGDDNKYTSCSVKCIPSVYVSCCAYAMRTTTMHDNTVDGTVDKSEAEEVQRSQDMEVWTRVDRFRENLTENRAKRNAIYIKPQENSFETEPLIYAVTSENDYKLFDRFQESHSVCDDSHAIVPTNESETSSGTCEVRSDAHIKPFNSSVTIKKGTPHCHVPNHSSSTHYTEAQLVEWNNENASRINYRSSLVIAFQTEALRRHINTQLAFSTGLNRMTLVYDKRLYTFLINVPINEPHKNVNMNRRDSSDMLIIFHKTHGAPALVGQRKQLTTMVERVNRTNLNDFVLHSRSILETVPKRIDDFEMNRNETKLRNKNVIEDFQRPIKEMLLPKATLNDFEFRRPAAVLDRDNYYSSTTNEYKEDHEIKIRNCEVRGGAMVTATAMNESTTDENIYQSIWKFQTVGSARESDVSFISEYYTASEYCEEVVDVAEWEVAEEFAFATQRSSQLIDLHDAASYEDNRSVRSGTTVDPYRTVCILYNYNTTKYNKIIYDYNGNDVFGTDLEAEKKIINVLVPPENKCAPVVQNVSNETVYEPSKDDTLLTKGVDSVFAWQKLIRSAAYMEDEEDLMLPESFLIEHLIQANNEENSKFKSKSSSDSSPMVSSNESLSEQPICKFSEKHFDEKTDTRILNTSPPPELKGKREIGFLNKLHYRRFDVAKNNKKEEGVQGLFYKNLDSKMMIEAQHISSDMRKIPASNLVFGVDLDEVEKDEKFTNIPKFVVECIKIIELDENIQTNGIYRASGKKESIDKLKKKMNESKLRKGTKYVALKDEDVHTVTGALKQFFRELKTDLIPIEIVKRLPDDLERKENLVKIKMEMDTIDFLPRESLKYLLKHLIFVDKNSDHNLMNATNLSIVWGACIFASSVTAVDTIETSDLMKKNTLFKILIQRFHDIFPNV